MSYPGKIDDTQVQNILLNYDDCDNDGMLDYYDCDPSVPQGQKMKICHNGNTICINSNAAAAHQSHCDYPGPCTGSITIPGDQITEENTSPGVSVYPSPATNEITIRNNTKTPLGAINIYDVSGKMVYQNFAGASQIVINVQKFASGIYYLKSGQSATAVKFVKQ